MTFRKFSLVTALCLPALAGCSSGHGSRTAARTFTGAASLPLSGDFAPAGQAFRDGFLQGLASASDSTIAWSWGWHDNEGAPDLLQLWVDSLSDTTRTSPDLLLGGLGAAVTGVDLSAVRAPLLWFGDGSAPTHPELWPLWQDVARLRGVLASWIAAQDTPSVALVLADAAWTPPFLDTTWPGMEVYPHDPLARRWDREIGQILSRKPRTLICWNRPEDASAFVARPLIASFLAGRTLLLPEGATAPEGANVSRFRPLWQPSLPVDSAQTAFLRRWGAVVGRAVASSTLAKVRDSLPAWRDAFRRARCDSLRLDPGTGGWLPVMDVVPDSLASH